MRRVLLFCLITVVAGAEAGCVSVPPQVLVLHNKEGELLSELRRTHLAMVDAYVDLRLGEFESFFFREYGPEYYRTWVADFQEHNGRPYDSQLDLSVLYNDLVAEYQRRTRPIEDLRVQLRVRITTAHDQAAEIHASVGRWIKSVEDLNVAQREAIDNLLAAIQPGLSLDSVDQAFERARSELSTPSDSE